MIYISYLSVYIPALVGVWAFKNGKGTVRLIIMYIWMKMLLEIGADYLKVNSINNLFLFHIHTYIEFFFIAVLFGNLIKARGKRIALNAIVFIFLLSSFLLLFLHQNIFEFNSVQRHIEGFLITLILCFFILENAERKDLKTPKPLINLSWMFLMYFTGNLFLFALWPAIFEEGTYNLWMIHSVLNILLNLVFAYVMIALTWKFSLLQRKQK